MLLPSLCEWVDTREQLDRYMPRKRGFAQKLAWAMRILYEDRARARNVHHNCAMWPIPLELAQGNAQQGGP